MCDRQEPGAIFSTGSCLNRQLASVCRSCSSSLSAVVIASGEQRDRPSTAVVALKQQRALAGYPSVPANPLLTCRQSRSFSTPAANFRCHLRRDLYHRFLRRGPIWPSKKTQEAPGLTDTQGLLSLQAQTGERDVGPLCSRPHYIIHLALM